MHVHGEMVLYDEIVCDVLMGIEEYYLREYGKDISNLQMLVNQFDTLEKSNGHPFMRLLLGWKWPWT